MKTPDPKEELLQQLATSLLRDVFAAATLAGIHASQQEGYPDPGHAAVKAFEQAQAMVDHSNTPALIEQISKLKS